MHSMCPAASVASVRAPLPRPFLHVGAVLQKSAARRPRPQASGPPFTVRRLGTTPPAGHEHRRPCGPALGPPPLASRHRPGPPAGRPPRLRSGSRADGARTTRAGSCRPPVARSIASRSAARAAAASPSAFAIAARTRLASGADPRHALPLEASRDPPRLRRGASGGRPRARPARKPPPRSRG